MRYPLTTRRARVLAAAATVTALAVTPMASAAEGGVEAPAKDRASQAEAQQRNAAKHVTPADRRQAFHAEQADKDDVARKLGLGDRTELQVRDVVLDPDGTRHVRYDRTYAGLRVIGGDLVVHLDNRHVKGVDRAHRGSIAPKTLNPSVGKGAALAKSDRQARFPAQDTDAELVVFAGGKHPRLAWESVVEGVRADQTPSRLHVVVDARNGKLLAEWDEIKTGQGDSIYSGVVPIGTTGSGSGYEMRDTSRGGNYTIDMFNQQSGGSILTDADDFWGNGTMSDPDSAGVDAHYGAALTWDYFLDQHDRTGIFNNGQGVPSRVHYGDSYVNAFWDGSRMTYGDGVNNQNPLVEVDVAAHEMSHGVTEATAGLVYYGDAGGLNESTSDIFGAAVEFSANNSEDVGDYLIGEEIDINGNGTPLRYMDRPSRDGRSYDCWSSGMGSDDPHYTSGPGNHFFYLASEGSGAKVINGVSYNSPTCDGSTVDGIGRQTAAKIWYRALSVYMTSTTDYPEARDATVQAAIDLFGGESTQCAGIEAAWDGVDVPVDSVTCGAGPDPDPEPGACSDLPEQYAGSLGYGGDYEYQPGSSGYYYSAAGTHVGCLDGPAGVDFDLYLERWNGSRWVRVAQSISPGPDEQISYNGSAGNYSWVIQSYTGSGGYAFGLDRP